MNEARELRRLMGQVWRTSRTPADPLERADALEGLRRECVFAAAKVDRVPEDADLYVKARLAWCASECLLIAATEVGASESVDESVSAARLGRISTGHQLRVAVQCCLTNVDSRAAGARAAHDTAEMLYGVESHLRAMGLSQWAEDVGFAARVRERMSLQRSLALKNVTSVSEWVQSATVLLWLLALEWSCGYGRRPLRWAAAVVGLVLAFAAVYYPAPLDYMGVLAFSGRGEGAASIESIYMSVVAFTTLGYGDIVPKNDAARIVTSIETLLGYGSLGVLVGLVFARVRR